MRATNLAADTDMACLCNGRERAFNSWPFFLAAAAAFVASIFTFLLLSGFPSIAGNPGLFALCVMLGVMLVPVGCFCLLLPAVIMARAHALRGFSQSLLEVNARWTDLEAVRREHYKARTAIESLADGLVDEKADLVATCSELRQLVADRKQTDDELSRQRQETAMLDRKVREWEQVAKEFFQSLERVIEDTAGNLSPEVVKAYEKACRDFARCIGPTGADVIRPEKDAPFDGRLHKIVADEPSSEVMPGHVLRCTAWGFRFPDSIEHARVVLATAPPVQVASGAPDTGATGATACGPTASRSA